MTKKGVGMTKKGRPVGAGRFASVIPAQAGIQCSSVVSLWIPAFAGMTKKGVGMTKKGVGMTKKGGVGMTKKGVGMTKKGDGMTKKRGSE